MRSPLRMGLMSGLLLGALVVSMTATPRLALPEGFGTVDGGATNAIEVQDARVYVEFVNPTKVSRSAAKGLVCFLKPGHVPGQETMIVKVRTPKDSSGKDKPIKGAEVTVISPDGMAVGLDAENETFSLKPTDDAGEVKITLFGSEAAHTKLDVSAILPQDPSTRYRPAKNKPVTVCTYTWDSPIRAAKGDFSTDGFPMEATSVRAVTDTFGGLITTGTGKWKHHSGGWLDCPVKPEDAGCAYLPFLAQVATRFSCKFSGQGTFTLGLRGTAEGQWKTSNCGGCGVETPGETGRGTFTNVAPFRMKGPFPLAWSDKNFIVRLDQGTPEAKTIVELSYSSNAYGVDITLDPGPDLRNDGVYVEVDCTLGAEPNYFSIYGIDCPF